LGEEERINKILKIQERSKINAAKKSILSTIGFSKVFLQ
jgi:hypothetical protein